MKNHRSVAIAVAAVGIALTAPAVRLSAQQSMSAMPEVSIASPAAGSTISGGKLDVTVKASNFKIECANVGQPGTLAMQGHVHAMVDGMDMEHLSGMYCSDHFTISTAGLKPGKHMLTVVLADDAHAMASLPASIPFELDSASAQALPPASSEKATIAIVSPKNGDVVGRKFDLKLATSHFNLSCDLEGRADIAGTGHLHVFASEAGVTDKTGPAPMMAMMATEKGKMIAQKMSKDTGMPMARLQSMMTMAMPGLLGMPCTTTVPVDLSAWKAGTVKLTVMYANNDHMPTAGVTPASVSLTLR